LFDEVRASHILEHFPHGQAADVLKEWARLLAPGGILKIAVPDFDWIVKAYSNGRRQDGLLEAYLFGGQVDADDYHKAFFNEDKLKRLLEDAGLTDVKRWEADAEDCSSLAVSLNLQGVKKPWQ
jgi:predicted SAM-dependent methyltransferase